MSLFRTKVKVQLSYVTGSDDKWREILITRDFPAVPRIGDRIWQLHPELPSQLLVKDIIWRLEAPNEEAQVEVQVVEWPIKTEVE